MEPCFQIDLRRGVRGPKRGPGGHTRGGGVYFVRHRSVPPQNRLSLASHVLMPITMPPRAQKTRLARRSGQRRNGGNPGVPSTYDKADIKSPVPTPQ